MDGRRLLGSKVVALTLLIIMFSTDMISTRSQWSETIVNGVIESDTIW